MGKFIVEKHNGESIWRLYENEYGDIAGEEAYLTLYTEPDLERIRLEAEQLGMVLAWEAARKIELGTNDGGLSADTMTEIFGTLIPNKVLRDFTASEVIEKLRAYEQEQEEYHIGDEVTAEHGGATFTVTWMSDVCICGIDSDGRCYSYELNEVDGKTGNHHDIATVLEKMRGEQDG